MTTTFVPAQHRERIEVALQRIHAALAKGDDRTARYWIRDAHAIAHCNEMVVADEYRADLGSTPDAEGPRLYGKATLSREERVEVRAYETPDGTLQVAIESVRADGSATGYRLLGRKFDGSSRLLASSVLDEHDRAVLRSIAS